MSKLRNTSDMENYEQKYKEALENARWKIEHVDCGDENCFNIDDIKDLFSELHESEDDKIRKWLINLLSKMQYHHCDDEMEMGNKALTWLEKQGEQKAIDKIQLGKKYKCIASPRYSTFMTGEIYKPEDKFVCSLMNLCSDCFEPIEDDEQKHAWSEEDERILGKCIDAASGYYSPEDKQSMKEWLKSLKDRVLPQPKQEWSEDDEKKIMWLVRLISTAGFRELDNDKMPCSRSKLLDWLKSIKPNHWKPSEEQMIYLKEAINKFNFCDSENTGLQSLYNDLKQL